MPFTAMKVGAVQGSASVGRGHFARSLLVTGGVSGATCNASPRDNGRLLLAAREAMAARRSVASGVAR
jgi:hypothetical protein